MRPARPGSLSRRRLLGGAALLAAVPLTGCTVPFSASPRGVWLVEAGGGNLRRVADGNPVLGWRTDSGAVALQYPDGSLRAVPVAGGSPAPVTSGLYTGRGWSPDGERRAMIDSDQNQLRIETVAGDAITTMTLREEYPALWLTADPVHEVPVWSPLGDRIAFVAWDGNGDALYTIAPDGSSRVKLTSIPLSGNQTDRYPWLDQRVATGDAANPAWSPDGQYLAYGVMPEVRGGQPGLFIAPATGGWRGRLTDQAPLFGPAWAPNGQSVVYAARADQWINLFQVPATGGISTNLTGGSPMNARYPAWSPSGDQLAFAGAGDLFQRDQTGNIALLADTGLVTETPVWSPDGSLIAFRGVPAQPGR